MPHSIASPVPVRHANSLDVGRPRVAKAAANKVGIASVSTDRDWMKAVGSAVRRAIAVVGWSEKEAAGKLGVDPGDFAKWLSGDRRPQFDRLFAIEALQQPLVICLARLANGRVSERIEFPDREAVNR